MDDLENLEDVFGGKENTPEPTEQQKPEATPEAKPEAPADQPRDENGRFAAKATEPEPQPASAAPVEAKPEAAPQKPLVDPEQFKGYLEEREKRQAAEKRAEERERELKALRERLEQQPQPLTFDQNDPESFAAQVQRQIYLASLGSKFETSEVLARQTHGDDIVQTAMQWGMEKSDPVHGGSLAFRDQYAAQRHPVDWIVKQYKRDQLLSQIGDKDPLEWAKELLAQQQPAASNPQAATPASPQPAPAATPPPTRSLASATSAGGIAAPVDPGLAPLEQVFGR